MLKISVVESKRIQLKVTLLHWRSSNGQNRREIDLVQIEVKEVCVHRTLKVHDHWRARQLK